MSSTDRNHTNVEKSGIDSKTKRVGDITGELPTNEATDHNKAAKMANLLEGLEFPATKEKIRNHLNARSPNKGNRKINDVVEAIENNLDEGREYHSAYEVEVAAGTVVKGQEDEKKPYAGDSGLNRANYERISSASSKDVSPNTPKGENI
jgi:hypothetical protein